MATPAKRQWENSLFTNQKAPAASQPSPAPAPEKPDDGQPDFTGPYRAFGHPRADALRSLAIYFNAEERKRYGRKKVQIQYEHLDSDDPETEGFAADGKSFSFVVATGRGFLRYTVHGWQLEEGYDQILLHKMPWLRSTERDFRKADGSTDGPVITGVEIVAVKEDDDDAAQAAAGGRADRRPG